MRNYIKTILGASALVAGMLSFAKAHAHVYWIEPNEFFFYQQTKNQDKKVTELLSWEVTGGDTFFNADVNRAYKEPVEYQFGITGPYGGNLTPLLHISTQSRALFEASIDKPGTYSLQMSRVGKPMYFTKLKSGEWIAKGATQLTDTEQNQAEKTAGYFQHAKSYFSFHKATDSWRKVLGHVLEIVPLKHPNKLYVGDQLAFKVLYKGRPVESSKVKVIPQGFRSKNHGEIAQIVTTDPTGLAIAVFDQPGRYLLTTSHDDILLNDPNADHQSHSASLMLEVNEPWVKNMVEPTQQAE